MSLNQIHYINKFEEINFCGKKILLCNASSLIQPFKIEPTEGEHNYSSCSGCQELKKTLIEKLKTTTSLFPFCCDFHKNLNKLEGFKLSDFKNLEEQIADKIIFSHQHIINNLEKENWYEEITQYLDYVISSFGSFPNEFGSPFQIHNYENFLLDLLRGYQKQLKGEFLKRNIKIYEYVENAFKANTKKVPDENNFNIILKTYNEWFNTFPFELSYFNHLKEQFSKEIPILKGKTVPNKYSNVTTIKLKTKNELLQSLLTITSTILKEINGKILYEKDLLTNAEKVQEELILNNRNLELSRIGKLKDDTKTEYIKEIKNWFKGEKKFIKEIKPFLDKRDLEKTKKDNKNKLTIPQIALKLIYEGVVVSRENCNELVQKYHHKSGNKLYNEYCKYSSTTNRKANPEAQTKKTFENKIRLFEIVIESLEDNYKQRAIDELNIIKSNYKTFIR